MNEFEQYLESTVRQQQSNRVKEAMRYSLMIGGKRIRPRLLFATLDMYGTDPKIGYPAACAIEMVHTYSLIHDDLPAMDNDDLRRGRPSCHKAFDEATAILAGDGLLTKAFDVILKTDIEPHRLVEMVRYLSDYAGIDGMIYGQQLDIQAEMSDVISLEDIYQIDRYKTSKLLTLPLIFGSILADHTKDIPIMIQIGNDLGIQFQIQDDILDATKTSQEIGKSTSDRDNHKQTIVSLLGIDAAGHKVQELEHHLDHLLLSLGRDTSSLKQLLSYLTKRTY